jgi:Meiotically up-regulated gene 113
MTVYFIQADDQRRCIKIGCSGNVGTRFHELQIACPVRLHVIGLCPGGSRVERELQKRFRAYNLWGEWYLPAPEILALVATLPPFDKTAIRLPHRVHRSSRSWLNPYPHFVEGSAA